MKFLFLLLSLIKVSNSFTPTVFLNGPIGEITAHSVPRSVSYKYIKKYEIEEIKKDSPIEICQELSCAREILRSPDRINDNVSFFMIKEKHLFTVIYRISDKFPKIYTIESIIRTPETEFRSKDINTILEQMCNDRKGFIQLHCIKRWANGRYQKESYLENQF